MSDSASSVTSTLDTKILMSASAGFTGLLGFGMLLFSAELLAAFEVPSEGFSVALVGLAGTLYLGFAMLNWMARDKLIGGIYSRPVAIGNFTHFLAGSIVLVKQIVATSNPIALGAVAAVYALFAAGFGYVAFVGGGSCG